MDKENNLGIEFEASLGVIQSPESNEEQNQQNREDKLREQEFQDYLVSPKGRMVLECLDEMLKGRDNLSKTEMGNFPRDGGKGY